MNVYRLASFYRFGMGWRFWWLACNGNVDIALQQLCACEVAAVAMDLCTRANRYYLSSDSHTYIFFVKGNTNLEALAHSSDTKNPMTYYKYFVYGNIYLVCNQFIWKLIFPVLFYFPHILCSYGVVSSAV